MLDSPERGSNTNNGNKIALSTKGQNLNFFESEVVKVEELESKYAITYGQGKQYYLPKKHNVKPKAGDTIRFYRGYPTLGVDLNGVEVFYGDLCGMTGCSEKVDTVLNLEAEDESTEIKRLLNEMKTDPFEFSSKGEMVWEGITERNMASMGKNLVFLSYVWAKQMEKGMQDGKSVSDIANETLAEVLSQHSNSGFSFNVSLSILTTCWKYGKQLDSCYMNEI